MPGVPMEQMSWWERIARGARAIFWIVFLAIFVVQAYAPLRLAAARLDVLHQLEKARQSRVIALIHRQESISLLGIPIARYIDIEDSEALLRAIRLTPDDKPIDLVLHTPGGLVLAAEQIAQALAEHKGKVTVFVPHYAMSGGTLLALAADAIVMDPNAVLGPVDPQLGEYPAASLIKLREWKTPDKISDKMLVLSDVAAKALGQVQSFVTRLLAARMPEPQAAALAKALSEGRWTHDYPITVLMAGEFGLPVSTKMPKLVYELMDLYHQAAPQRPGVLYIQPERNNKRDDTPMPASSFDG
ncbi:MAG TPA: ATP-dependent Clp protease proteolytic subunit [Gammaproteobacteria bacterium]|nr:ATP-dependent Clp protease proteolytic subunit [Gammaproteobacteria bacterium]